MIHRKPPPALFAQAADMSPALDHREVDVPLGLARSTDPATSHAAAERAVTSGTRKAHQGEVLRLVKAHPGMTAKELLPYTTVFQKYEQINRRTGELIQLGLIHARGERGGFRVLWPGGGE